MPEPIHVEPEAYVWPGLPARRYRKRVKSHVRAADSSLVMPYGETRSGSLLTPGEQAVLEGLADGLRSTEIAKNLNASVKTFYAVCERLREKLGARTDVHAVSIGFRRGLLQLERRKSRRTEDTPS